VYMPTSKFGYMLCNLKL